MKGNEAINIAIDCEATELEYRNGWYYCWVPMEPAAMVPTQPTIL